MFILIRLCQTLFFFNFYWSIVDLQCCVSFCCTEEWISYAYIHSFLDCFPIYVIRLHRLFFIVDVPLCNVWERVAPYLCQHLILSVRIFYLSHPNKCVVLFFFKLYYWDVIHKPEIFPQPGFRTLSSPQKETTCLSLPSSFSPQPQEPTNFCLYKFAFSAYFV